MKEYVRKRLDTLTLDTPNDVQMRTIYSIYVNLEEKGCTGKQIKEVIDAVVKEKIKVLKSKLNYYMTDDDVICGKIINNS